MARRLNVVYAGFRAGVSLGALGVASVACTPAPSVKPLDADNGYALCNSTGCGDNVNIVIDKDK